MSGGGSSLMAYPRGSITIRDKEEITSTLLRSGAVIGEVNAVRKHLSGVKGGWLAKKAYPATILNLILSDVIGDSLDTIASGPTVADSTTFSNARHILEKYSLWTNAPDSIKKVIADGEAGVIGETPKPGDSIFERVTNVIVGNNRTACLAACQHLQKEGIKTLLLTAMLEGEAKCVGANIAAVANEVLISGNPVPKPVALVTGGETTVKVTGDGVGGRNQELALAAALKLRRNEGVVVIASVGTDGVDGPTDAAGAIVDNNAYAEAASLGLKPEQYLAQNDSYTYFSKTGSLIFTGQTGTNINDIVLIIII
jgi:glycerate-2-kinase